MVPNGVLPNVPGQGGHSYILEATNVGTGDTWNEDLLWLSPGAVVTQLGTFANVTQAATKAFTWVYAGTAGTAAPPVNRVRLTLQTAGSSTLTANLYLITDSAF